ASGPQDPTHLPQGRRRIALQHIAEARENSVDARVRQLDPLRVEDAKLRVRDAEERSDALCGLDHVRRAVARDQLPRRAEPTGREEAGLARPGRQVENRLTELRVEGVDEPLADGACRLPEQLASALPAWRQLLPELTHGAPRAPRSMAPTPPRRRWPAPAPRTWRRSSEYSF